MSRIRHLTPALLGVALTIGVTLVACDDQRGDGAVSTAPPSDRQPLVDDPRIGEGLPAEVRFAGLEHNRLTLLMLRQARGPAQRDLAMRSPCETIVAGLTAESPRTATRAGIPGRADQLSTILRAFMSSHPDCGGRIGRPTLEAFADDARVTADAHPDSVLTDAAFVVLDRMLDRIEAATSTAEVTGAIEGAAAAAPSLGAIDALAVQAAVAQSQGSVILWQEGGAGWVELGAPVAAQSLFRASTSMEGFFRQFVKAVGADAAGCIGALQFMKQLPIVQDPRLLLAGCGLVGAAGTVYYGYNVYHQE